MRRRRRWLHNAERNVAFTLWCFTVPAGWRALRYYRDGGGRDGR